MRKRITSAVLTAFVLALLFGMASFAASPTPAATTVTKIPEPTALAAGVTAKTESGVTAVIKKLDETSVKSAVEAAKTRGTTLLKAMDISVTGAKDGKLSVSGIGSAGMKVTVLHFNGKMWESYGTYTVANDGTLTFKARSFSPFAFVTDSKTVTSPKTGDD